MMRADKTRVRFDDPRQVAQVEVGIGFQFEDASRRFRQRRNRQRLIEPLTDAQLSELGDAGDHGVAIVVRMRRSRLGADVDAEIEYGRMRGVAIELSVTQRDVFVGSFGGQGEVDPIRRRAGRRR